MIDGLSSEQRSWLSDFFAPPNELTWESLLDGSAPPELVESVRSWLHALADPDNRTPLVLPFVKSGRIACWYATTRTSEGARELAAELRGWLGPTYVSVFEAAPTDPSDPNAAALYRQSGGIVWRFTGANKAAQTSISNRLNDYIGILRRRPKHIDMATRPVGAIRADFERALVAKDAPAAERYIVELKETGRLNEENLRYLDVRLSAGLGLWPQIARDHWLIQTMSDLALPPRILADIIEALYRTHIDPVEATGDVAALLAAFATDVAKRYPRLFASRRGIRTSRVVKAFLLFELLQPRPNQEIINDLAALLGEEDKFRAFSLPPRCEPELTVDPEAEGDQAFDDLQYERAFAFYAALPLTKKIIGRLLTCVQFIDTNEARFRLMSLVEKADHRLIDALTPILRDKLAAIVTSKPRPTADPVAIGNKQAAAPAGRSVSSELDGWMAWAEQLERGEDLPSAERALELAVTNWTTSDFKSAAGQCRAFADIVGNLNGDASLIARRAVPQIFESFFSGDEPLDDSRKPIAEMLFLVVAMNDGLSAADLDILGQLLSILLTLGPSSDEYISIIRDLEDVQDRVRSYANLTWSLDICETLAVSPAQSDAARTARLSFFLRVLGQAQTFAHRLGPQDFLLMELLAKDFEVDPSSVDDLKRAEESGEIDAPPAGLSGKLIGIYTLAEAAGARAKAALEKMFPGSTVEVNSDLVATEKLRNLARTADLFVFAWKSSSHAAFYCIKDELRTGEPIWAVGKGTASIMRAVLDNVG
jgi:hypothetical protein